MPRFKQLVRMLALCLFAATVAISASAQTYIELLSFNGNSAAGPKTPLTQGVDGNLYGTTYYGGTGTCFDGSGYGCGVVFKLTRNGTLDVLYNFQVNNSPAYPINQLSLGDDGNFYGTTSGYGAIFKITPAGSLTTLHTFTNGSGGYYLEGGVIQGADGNFYGTTNDGGAPSNFCPSGCGTVFKMTPAGALTTLYSFCPQNYCPDGENPAGALVQGTDGNFYGTTTYGGLYKLGTFFKVSASGIFTLLYAFQGNPPHGGVILANDGNFYGTTYYTVYRLTPRGVFTDLSNLPESGYKANLMVQGTDGNLYSTTQQGGAGLGIGQIFEMPTDGTASTLYSFVGYPNDGSYPSASLVQATDGKFYGTTYSGGSSPCNYNYSPGCGTVFSLDMGLQPFVAFMRGAARVGQSFGIIGQGFTGTTSVSLNGTPASFTVKRNTLLIATVPAGATTGPVTVTTPSGTLNSNVSFFVIP